MRDEYPRLTALGLDVVAVAPATVEQVQEFLNGFPLPFLCLADPTRSTFRHYRVRSSFLSMGQRPAVLLLGEQGEIVHGWYGRQQWEIPSIDEVVEWWEKWMLARDGDDRCE